MLGVRASIHESGDTNIQSITASPVVALPEVSIWGVLVWGGVTGRGIRGILLELYGLTVTLLF